MHPLQTKLRGLLGAPFVPEVPLSQFAVDGREPQVVVQLDRREEIANLVEWSRNQRLAIIPWGSGTSMSIGNVPRKYDIALSTLRLNRLVEYTPEDMTVTVEAGMTMGELQAHLREHGQFLPVEAPGNATVGGIIASNRYGPSRLAWGMVRDWLIGIRFVCGDGRIIHGGGKVVKNVAGYDLCRLLVGSHGTLGVIVEATFKVAPLPEATCTCLTTLAHLSQITSSPLRPRFVEWLNVAACRAVGVDSKDEETLLVGFAGTREEVEWQASQLATKQIDWTPSRMEAFGAKEPMLARIVGRFSETNALHRHIAGAFGERIALTAHASLGVFRLALVPPHNFETLAARFREKYQLILERAPLDVKQEVDAWGLPGSSLPLMRAVKEQLDPHGILNPGRFVGGI